MWFTMMPPRASRCVNAVVAGILSLFLAASCDENGGPAQTPPPEATKGLGRVIQPEQVAGPAVDWPPPRYDGRKEDRMDLIQKIRRRYGFDDKKVLDALGNVPRHEFVRAGYSDEAYDDRALPIGFGQTISQPYVVAEMTRRLQLTEESRVLEIGTGSGYQAAVLAEITPHVYTIEIVGALAEQAAQRLDRLGYDSVVVKHDDGFYGWSDKAPFDAIIVTAASAMIPAPLIEQLKPGGRMVIPVGPPGGAQWLMLVEKNPEGKVRSKEFMAVRFVPFTRAKTSE